MRVDADGRRKHITINGGISIIITILWADRKEIQDVSQFLSSYVWG